MALDYAALSARLEEARQLGRRQLAAEIREWLDRQPTSRVGVTMLGYYALTELYDEILPPPEQPPPT